MQITRTVTEEVSYNIRKYIRDNLDPKMYERTDIFCIQWIGACNVFVETDGRYQIDLWDKSIQVDKEEIAKVVDQVMNDNQEFIAEQAKHIESYLAKRAERHNFKRSHK